jgi:hypothetical protein
MSGFCNKCGCDTTLGKEAVNLCEDCATKTSGTQPTITNNARDAILSELSVRVAYLERITKGLTGDHVRG